MPVVEEKVDVVVVGAGHAGCSNVHQTLCLKFS